MDRKTRDKQIYLSYKKGLSIKHIARIFNIKPGRVVMILGNNSNQYCGEKLKRMIKSLQETKITPSKA